MPVTIRCPNPVCGAKSTVDDAAVDRPHRCPQCNKSIALKRSTIDSATVKTLPASPPSAAEKIGRYELRGRLGAGAFGTVYRAYDSQLGRDIALKVPNAGVLDSPKRIERFLREAKAAANLRHPGIVPVYDTGKDGDTYYIASGFIDGKPLSEEVSEGPLTLRAAAEMAMHLASAVGHAHSQGIVHRDIKPANVMVDKLGRPNLMDFGLAARAEDLAKLTSDGAVMGTPSYMAPEQAAGQKGEANPLADQYALGVVLYELLTGKVPFVGPLAVVIHNVIHAQPEAPSKFRQYLDIDLETICLKAMAKRPEDRYPNCAAMEEDLRSWLANEPIAARKQTAVEKAWRWAKKNKVVAGLSAAVAVSLMVGVIVSARYGVVATAAAKRADADRTEAENQRAKADAATRVSQQNAASLLLDKAIGRFDLQDNTGGYLNLASSLELCAGQSPDLERQVRRQLGVWSQSTPQLESIFEFDDADLPGSRFELRSDGQLAAIGYENRIELLPAGSSTGVKRTLKFEGYPYRMRISPSGRWLAASNVIKQGGAPTVSRVWVWDLERPSPVPIEIPHDSRVSDLLYLRGEEQIATVTTDHTVRNWNLAAPKTPLAELKLGGAPLDFRTHADDRKLLIVEAGTRKVQLWNPGEPPTTLRTFPPGVTCGAISTDASATAFAAGFGVVFGFGGQTSQAVIEAGGQSKILFLSGGRAAAVNCHDGVQVFDTLTAQRLCHLHPSSAGVSRIMSHGEDRLVTLEHRLGNLRQMIVRVWRFRPVWAPEELYRHKAVSLRVAVGHKTGVLASISVDGEAIAFDLATRKAMGSVMRHPAAIVSVALSPDETKMLTGSHDGRARLWNLADQSPIWEHDFRQGSIWGLAFSRDGGIAYIGTQIGEVFELDASSKKQLRSEPLRFGRQVNSIAPDPVGEYLLVGTELPPPRRVNLKKATPEYRILNDIAIAKSVAINRAGTRYLMTTWGGYGLVYDARDDRPIGQPIRHPKGIWQSSFSPDEELIATASMDKTARLWDADSGKPVGLPIVHPNFVTGASFTGSGKELVTSNDDGVIRLFNIPPPFARSASGAKLYAEVFAGAVLEPDGAVRLLNATEWEAKRKALASSEGS